MVGWYLEPCFVVSFFWFKRRVISFIVAPLLLKGLTIDKISFSRVLFSFFFLTRSFLLKLFFFFDSSLCFAQSFFNPFKTAGLLEPSFPPLFFNARKALTDRSLIFCRHIGQRTAFIAYPYKKAGEMNCLTKTPAKIYIITLLKLNTAF